MAPYPLADNRGVPSRCPLLLVLLLTLLSLLAGCSVSTTTGSPQWRARTRELKGRITEFPLPASANSPFSITAGPDGALWFTETQSGEFAQGAGGKIGRITLTGQISKFPLPAPLSHPASITAGPDGALWFTDVIFINNVQSGAVKLVGKIGRITPVGHISEFPLLTPDNQPLSITTGPDGNLWFTEGFNVNSNRQSSKIGRISPAGHISEFPLSPHDSTSIGITTGPDGALWFTEVGLIAQSGKYVGKIGRITLTGQISGFPLPTAANVLQFLTAGSDGNLWFTEFGSDGLNGKIGRLT